MRKVRNAVIIIVLCIIGGYKAYKPAHLGMTSPVDHLHDAVAGSGLGQPNPTNASNPNLHLSNSDDEGFHDSVAANAVPGFGPNGGNGNGGSPRGSTDGGFGSFSQQNPNSQTGPSPLSPSGPASPSSPPK